MDVQSKTQCNLNQYLEADTKLYVKLTSKKIKDGNAHNTIYNTLWKGKHKYTSSISFWPSDIRLKETFLIQRPDTVGNFSQTSFLCSFYYNAAEYLNNHKCQVK